MVDAFTAQHADQRTKPIAVAFSVAGLYLHVEQGFSGQQVQDAHRQMAREKRSWPAFALPDDRGAVTVRDVVAQPPGIERDQAIDRWCSSVWEAFSINRAVVVDLLREHRIL